MTASQLSGHCDVISNLLWHNQENENQASETRGRSVKLVVFIVIYDSLYCVRNKMMYVLSWRTISALTRVLFWYLFPSLLRNSGNKHQNNPLVSAETIHHSSTYIILYLLKPMPTMFYDALLGHNELTHWGLDEINNISQTTFSNVFSSMKMFKFRLKFHWSLFPRVQLTIFQHWFR